MRTTSVLTAAAVLTLAAGCGSDGGPAVGKCTNQDPDLTVQVVAIEVVDCSDDAATQEIVRRSPQGGRDCEAGRLTTGEGEAFCTRPLRRSGA